MRRLLLLVIVFAGCEKPDPMAPIRDPLPVGAEVLTHYDTSYGVPGRDDATVVRARFKDGPAEIPVGTKVRVTDDSGAERQNNSPHRKVKVLILEGPYSGRAAELERERLRK